jgi:hypothetical protein
MAKYATTFVFNKADGTGLIKVMSPVHDNIKRFYMSINPEFSTLEEFNTNVFDGMPAAKQKMWTEEMKEKAVKDEVELAAIRKKMADLFLENNDLVPTQRFRYL